MVEISCWPDLPIFCYYIVCFLGNLLNFFQMSYFFFQFLLKFYWYWFKWNIFWVHFESFQVSLPFLLPCLKKRHTGWKLGMLWFNLLNSWHPYVFHTALYLPTWSFFSVLRFPLIFKESTKTWQVKHRVLLTSRTIHICNFSMFLFFSWIHNPFWWIDSCG